MMNNVCELLVLPLFERDDMSLESTLTAGSPWSDEVTIVGRVNILKDSDEEYDKLPENVDYYVNSIKRFHKHPECDSVFHIVSN